jgi:hypothetical protein
MLQVAKFREYCIDDSMFDELEDMWDELEVAKPHRMKIRKLFGIPKPQ